MAFKYICSSLFLVIACTNVLVKAHPLSYLRDNSADQSIFPYQNQQPFVYLRDNGVNQIQQTLPIQTVSTYSNVFNNAGFLPYPNNAVSTNFVNNVNNVNNVPAQYSTVAQSVPFVNYPNILPVAQYGVQPAIVGGVPSYGYPNQITTNTQSAPIEINYAGAGCR